MHKNILLINETTEQIHNDQKVVLKEQAGIDFFGYGKNYIFQGNRKKRMPSGKKIFLFLFVFLFSGCYDREMKNLLTNLKKIWDLQDIKYEKVSAQVLNWKIVKDNGQGYLFFAPDPKTGLQKIKLLYIFPRKGSFYNSFLPQGPIFMPDGEKDQNKIKEQITGLEKLLKENDFPSPKHRYGIQVELNHLKKSLKVPEFHSGLLGLQKQWLIFSAENLTLDQQNMLLDEKNRQSLGLTILDIGEKFSIDEFSEGMARGDLFPSGILNIRPLPYAFYRKDAHLIFNRFPSIHTIILNSIDSHSLGAFGIQIENRSK